MGGAWRAYETGLGHVADAIRQASASPSTSYGWTAWAGAVQVLFRLPAMHQGRCLQLLTRPARPGSRKEAVDAGIGWYPTVHLRYLCPVFKTSILATLFFRIAQVLV